MVDTIGNIVEDRAQRVLLADEYIPLVESGVKTSTIRKGLRDFYPGQTIALKATDSGEEIFFHVAYVTYKFAEDLNEEDARRDGFSDFRALWAALSEIYPDLEPENFVTIVGLEKRRTP